MNFRVGRRALGFCLVVMVFFFLSNVSDPPTVLFMGRDKHENEDLIKWGWPEDVWFHVDKVSSAHVYLRLAPGQSLETVRNCIWKRRIRRREKLASAQN